MDRTDHSQPGPLRHDHRRVDASANGTLRVESIREYVSRIIAEAQGALDSRQMIAEAWQTNLRALADEEDKEAPQSHLQKGTEEGSISEVFEKTRLKQGPPRRMPRAEGSMKRDRLALTLSPPHLIDLKEIPPDNTETVRSGKRVRTPIEEEAPESSAAATAKRPRISRNDSSRTCTQVVGEPSRTNTAPGPIDTSQTSTVPSSPSQTHQTTWKQDPTRSSTILSVCLTTCIRNNIPKTDAHVKVTGIWTPVHTKGEMNVFVGSFPTRAQATKVSQRAALKLSDYITLNVGSAPVTLKFNPSVHEAYMRKCKDWSLWDFLWKCRRKGGKFGNKIKYGENWTSSNMIGVCRREKKRTLRYEVRIRHVDFMFRLGTFLEEAPAGRAYDSALLHFHEDFPEKMLQCVTNFRPSLYTREEIENALARSSNYKV